jgi:hypothetical protein
VCNWSGVREKTLASPSSSPVRMRPSSTTPEQTGMNPITRLSGYPPSCKLLKYAYWRPKISPWIPKLTFTSNKESRKVAGVITKKRSVCSSSERWETAYNAWDSYTEVSSQRWNSYIKCRSCSGSVLATRPISYKARIVDLGTNSTVFNIC